MTQHNHVANGRTTHEERRALAKQIAEESAALTPAQKIARLDARLGKGVGASRERARLAKSSTLLSKDAVQ